MKNDDYVVYPDCPDCTIDAEGRLLCLQSRDETHGIKTIVMCAGIPHFNCDYKIKNSVKI